MCKCLCTSRGRGLSGPSGYLQPEQFGIAQLNVAITLVLIYVHKITLTYYLFIHIIASLKAYSLHFSIISYYITKSNDLVNLYEPTA